MSTEVEQRFTEVWRANRAHLVDIAFRMLGDVGRAEDVAQEAFARLMRADLDEIRDERGWLIVVTSRLCLDHIRSAQSRREAPHRTDDVAALDVVAESPLADPADRVTLDDNVRLALLVVLQRLSPAERVVFVLHDVFQLPFETIAETVGRTAPGCRQLARRARQKIAEDGGARFEVDGPEQRSVTERFMTACRNGDLDELLAVLDPAVTGDVDWGDAPPRGRAAVGAPAAARNLLRHFAGATLVSHTIDGRPVLLAFSVERELSAVLELTIDGEVIRKLHAVLDPVKLARLQAELAKFA